MNKILIVAIISIFSLNALAVDKRHHHQKKTLTMNNGKKWEVDQVVNENMSAIQAQYNKTKDNILLSKKITDSAQNMISKCKLDPKTDEAFHLILADLFMIANELKDPQKAKHAHETLARTLEKYSEYFIHRNPAI